MTQQQASPFRSFPNTIVRASLLVGALLGVAVPARAHDAIRPWSPLGAHLADIARQTGQPLAPMLDAAHPWVPPAPDAAALERNRVARMMRATARPFVAQSNPAVDFAVLRDLNPGQEVSEITPGDFNGDGRADVALIETPGGLAVMLGSSNGLSSPTTLSVPATPAGVACGDFDGDGMLDLAVALQAAPGLAILHGNGDGTFAAAQPLAFPLGLWAIAAGDLDGDGRMDLAAVETSDSSLVVLLNAGGGSFPTAVRYTVPASNPWPWVGIALGDFDGDGRLDVATARIVGGSGTNPPRALSVHLNQGGGAFGSRSDYTLGVNPWTISAGDLDRDGRDDLVLGAISGEQASVLRAGAGGILMTPAVVGADIPQPGGYRFGARLADMDGDGRLDLVLTYNDGDCYNGKCLVAALLRGVGDATFEAPMSWHAGDADGAGGNQALAIADITGDHVPDLVVARRNPAQATYLLPGLRAPQWIAPARRPVGSGPYALNAGRLRPGARPDLVASGSGSVYTMRNRGNGTFADPDSFAAGALATLEDFNQDGLQDVVIAIDGTTEVRLANGTGGFGPPTTLTAGAFIAAGDFTGDGHPDLGVQLASGNVGVLAGDGAGHFGPATDFGRPLVAYARAARAADLDDDGRADLLVAYGDYVADHDSLIVLWSSGSGFFAVTRAALGPRYPSEHEPAAVSDIQTGDFDGDGRLDVVATRCGNDNLGVIDVLMGGASRSLSAMVEYDAGNDPITAVVADFDGDGLDDVAVANISSSGTGRFSAFRSVGAAGLQRMPDVCGYGGYAVEHYATTIAAGDFDGDGRVDVAVGCLSAHSVIAVPNISPISAPTAVIASLVSANAQPDRVSLLWELGQLSVTSAAVERSGPSSSGWSALASVNVAAGRIAYEDRDVAAGARYGYRLRIATGSTIATSAETWVDVPNSLALAIAGARPNPTRGPLTVSFTLPTTDRARLELLDVTGRRVREHTFDAPTAGAHQVALEERGSLAPGLYFLRLSQSARVAEARVAVVR